MISGTRVLTVFANQEPDRVPIIDAANAGIDKRVKVHFRLNPDDEGLQQVLGDLTTEAPDEWLLAWRRAVCRRSACGLRAGG